MTLVNSPVTALNLTIEPDTTRLRDHPFTVRVRVEGLPSGQSIEVQLTTEDAAVITPDSPRVTIDRFHAWFRVTSSTPVDLAATGVDTLGRTASAAVRLDVPS